MKKRKKKASDDIEVHKFFATDNSAVSLPKSQNIKRSKGSKLKNIEVHSFFATDNHVGTGLSAKGSGQASVQGQDLPESAVVTDFDFNAGMIPPSFGNRMSNYCFINSRVWTNMADTDYSFLCLGNSQNWSFAICQKGSSVYPNPPAPNGLPLPIIATNTGGSIPNPVNFPGPPPSLANMEEIDNGCYEDEEEEDDWEAWEEMLDLIGEAYEAQEQAEEWEEWLHSWYWDTMSPGGY